MPTGLNPWLSTPQHPPETPLTTIQQAAYAHLPAPRLAELAEQLMRRSARDDQLFYWA